MDGLKIKLIVGLAPLLLAGAAAVTRNHYINKIVALNTESQQRLYKLKAAERSVARLQKEREQLSEELRGLREEYKKLREDYRKCTTAEGLTYQGPSTDPAWHEDTLSTGDQLRFKLSSSSCYVKMFRITTRGPIMQILGCKPVAILDNFESASDGAYAYLLRKGKQFRMQVSSRGSAEGYLSSDLSDLECITIICQDYDVKQQTADFKFMKRFIER